VPRVTKKLGENKYLVPLLFVRGKYPRVSIPLEVAERLGLTDANFVALEVKDNCIIIKKAKVVTE